NWKKAIGSAANGAVVGAARGALIGSGAGIPLAFATDFVAGSVGNALEQGITTGKVNVGKSLLGGAENAISQMLYGTGKLNGVKDAFLRGAGVGAVSSGLRNIGEALWPEEMPKGRGAAGAGIPGHAGRDPRGKCGSPDPFDLAETLGNRKISQGGAGYGGGFSLGGLVKDMMIGGIVGGLGSAAFYGAGEAVDALKRGVIRSIGGQRRSKFLVLTDDEIISLKKDIRAIGADERIFRFNEGYQTGFSESSKLILVRGDVLPDLSSNHPRDLMSSRAVLAHEYYGHRYFDELYGVKNPLANSWNDEFRASYFAALKTPNLSDIDRHYLMADAVERAREAGVTIKLTDEIRRVLYGF
ncbi:MAG: hypothetical protein OSJ73_19315, partial [Lachnospiraceae bacterium]|nr:hypothetical protein [Lachnospiraceae bacterium]